MTQSSSDDPPGQPQTKKITSIQNQNQESMIESMSRCKIKVKKLETMRRLNLDQKFKNTIKIESFRKIGSTQKQNQDQETKRAVKIQTFLIRINIQMVRLLDYR